MPDLAARRLTPFAQWWLLGTVMLLMGGIIVSVLYVRHGAIEAAESARLAARARVVDENLAHQLLATNVALDSIRRDATLLKPQGDGREFLIRRLKTMSDVMPGVRTLLILDHEGTVIAGNREELIGRNFHEREYFRAARRSADPAILHVSPPFTTVLGVFVINLTKVIPGKRGEFAGIVTATLDPDYFSTLLASVLDGPDMWSSLAHGDGRILLMVPARPGTEGADIAKAGSFFTRHGESGQAASVMTGIVAATGDEVMMAQRTIKPAGLGMDRDFRVAVARDLPSVFAGWRRDALAGSGLFGILVLTSTVGLLLLQRRQRAYDQLAADRDIERRRAENEMVQRAKELQALNAALQTVREEERERFARELHDDLGHLLTVLKMDLEWLTSRLPAQTERITAKLDSVGLLVNQVVDSVRRIMDASRPGTLDQLGLLPALREYVAKFVAHTGIHCELTTGTPQLELDKKVGIEIFRIVQEALDDIHLHAQASHVSIDLQRSADALMLVISDDGIGLPEAAEGEMKLLGVLGVRERVTMLNGGFSMTSREGRGVRIEMVIPVKGPYRH